MIHAGKGGQSVAVLESMDTEALALKLLRALKEEWERERSLLKCRNMADVASGFGLTQAEYDRAVNFVVENVLIKAVKRLDGKMAAQPSKKGFDFLESHKPKPESVPTAPQDSSDERPSDNDAPKKRQKETTQRVKPLHVKTPKKTRFSRTKFNAVCADIVGILFLWACLIESHSVSASICYFAALFVAYAPATYWRFENLKTLRWTCSVLTFIALNVFTAYFVSEHARPEPEPHQPAFYAHFNWTVRWDVNHKDWYVVETQYTKTRQRVDSSMLFEFTNLKPFPMMIAGYSFEQKLTDGTWALAATFPDSTGHLGRVFRGLNPAEQYDYITFDSQILNKTIASHETVRGWVHFIKDPTEMRMTVTTVAGEIYMELVHFGAEMPTNQFPIIHTPMMGSASAKEDISRFTEIK
jgi:hypothetical protein